jgi:hypothetical protein
MLARVHSRILLRALIAVEELLAMHSGKAGGGCREGDPEK